MTGDEIRIFRERGGVSVAELAEALGSTSAQVAAMERQPRVRKARQTAVAYALWEIERDRLLAHAGIPRCTWVASGNPKLKEWREHLESCETCQRRIGFVEEHVRPAPRPPGIFGSVLHAGDASAGWRESALAGGMLLIYMSGIGAPIIVLVGLWKLNVWLIFGAVGFLALAFVSGAVGGIVHYVTTRIRAAGPAGYYLSWVLSVYAYLLTVFIVIYAVEVISGAGKHQFDPADPTAWVVFAVVGLFCGIVWGRIARDKKQAGIPTDGVGSD